MLTIIQKFLKQQKKNDLLLNEIKRNNLLSTDILQNIKDKLTWQEREVIDNYNCLLFLEQQSNQLLIEAVDKEANKSNILKRIKTKLLLWIVLVKIDLILLAIA